MNSSLHLLGGPTGQGAATTVARKHGWFAHFD